MKPTIVYDLPLHDAICQAEGLAFALPDSHAVIYQGKRDGRRTLFVRPASEPAPEGAAMVTTVSRKPPAAGRVMNLRDAVEHMAKNLPAGVELAEHAHIQHYPKKRFAPSWDQPGIFCYEFMSTEGLNVGTWMPHNDSVLFQTGFEGRGRIHARAWVDGKVNGPRADISEFIVGAMVTDENPGDCTEAYKDGWVRAERSLRVGADPDEAPPDYGNEDRWNGHNDRLALERTIRLGRAMNRTASAVARPSDEAVVQGNLSHRPRP
ncbi:hypothetical protein ABIC83_002444 [Roseateles asaccharophilus]|uniref:hypothetical protein n=1 Tax=Roseateles asaccharophilus TaxID=582607 RepID=UPI003833A0CD